MDTTPYDDEATNVAQFELWLKTSRPGARFEYHRGLLAYDRETVTMMPQGYYAHVFHEPYHDLGTIAWAEYERGNVTLVQQKSGPGTYRYFAIKRKGNPNGKRKIYVSPSRGDSPRGSGRRSDEHVRSPVAPVPHYAGD